MTSELGVRSQYQTVIVSLKLRLHKQFFACNGDAIFFLNYHIASAGENHICSHPHTGDVTAENTAEIQHAECLVTKYKLIALPVPGLLQG